jgi:hypothetical protein
MKTQFQLFHTQYGETVHLVEMDDSLVQPEADIVDSETLTLRPLRGGGVYTLIPLEVDHRVGALRRLHQVYTKVTTEPIGVPSGMLSRMDALFEAVGVLFDQAEYVLVESKEDMQNLIDPPDDENYEPKKVKHNILGDLLDEITAEAKEEDQE